MSPSPNGQKSQLSKPSVSVFSWDSLDLSSEASRSLSSSAVQCPSVLSVVGNMPPSPSGQKSKLSKPISLSAAGS